MSGKRWGRWVDSLSVMDFELTGLGSEEEQRSEISQPSLSNGASLSDKNKDQTFSLRPGAPEKAAILCVCVGGMVGWVGEEPQIPPSAGRQEEGEEMEGGGEEEGNHVTRSKRR